KACVVAPYQVSHGTLSPIEMSVQGNNLVSSLCLPQGFAITDASTFGNVSTALLSANSFLHNGDQLSIVHLLQSFSDFGIPHTSMKLHKIIIDPSDNIPFRVLISQSMFQIINGRAGTDANAEAGGMAYVLSRSYGSKLLVSSQNIVFTPGYTLYKTYSSDAQKRKAMESYANIEDRYLDPSNKTGEDSQDPEDEYFAITGVTLNGTPVAQGSGQMSVSTGNVVVISGSKLTDVELKVRILINPPTGSTVTIDLSALGSVVSTDQTITVNVTTIGGVFYLLRADNDVVMYDFRA
ncbi:hypothetical protein EZS27_026758, partial [termite gut metagenome]